MNEVILAVWFMDDGNTDWMYRKGIKKYKNSRPFTKLCTDSFPIKDIEKLKLIIRLKFHIESYIAERNRLWFNADNTAKLLEILRPHIHECMLYKVDESVYSGVTLKA